MTGGVGWLQQLLASYGYLAVFALVGLESAGWRLAGGRIIVAVQLSSPRRQAGRGRAGAAPRRCA